MCVCVCVRARVVACVGVFVCVDVSVCACVCAFSEGPVRLKIILTCLSLAPPGSVSGARGVEPWRTPCIQCTVGPCVSHRRIQPCGLARLSTAM